MQKNVLRGAALLALSSLLFAAMGVLIRLASHTVNNETIVFARNLAGCLLLLPLLLREGPGFLRTQQPWKHLWRALVGLGAMYGFFYAIAHLPLANAMLFTYSSPVFIPLVARVFLHERLSASKIAAAIVGLFGVVLIARPGLSSGPGILNWVTLVGISASLLAAMAFVTVRALTQTEPVTRIVFYFALISTIVSAVPLLWARQTLSTHDVLLLAGIGVLATLSQLALSQAYAYAEASRIGPLQYLAVVFAGLYAWLLWQEVPDKMDIIGATLIFCAGLITLRPTVKLRPAANKSEP